MRLRISAQTPIINRMVQLHRDKNLDAIPLAKSGLVQLSQHITRNPGIDVNGAPAHCLQGQLVERVIRVVETPLPHFLSNGRRNGEPQESDVVRQVPGNKFLVHDYVGDRVSLVGLVGWVDFIVAAQADEDLVWSRVVNAMRRREDPARIDECPAAELPSVSGSEHGHKRELVYAGLFSVYDSDASVIWVQCGDEVANVPLL